MKKTRISYLIEQFVNPKETLIDYEDLITIVSNDPTTVLNGYDTNHKNFQNIKVGKYSSWLLHLYSEIKIGDKLLRDIFIEDLYKVKDDLIKFDRFKHRLEPSLRDINIHTTHTLYDSVKNFSLIEAITTKTERYGSYYHPGAKIFHEDENWLIMEISDQGELGKEAAVFYGGQNKETRWCTSAPGLSYFDTYTSKGPLYVFLNLNDSKKGSITGLPDDRYQIHFQTSQFMDKDDRSIDFPEFLIKKCSEEIKEKFKPKFYEGFKVSDVNSFVVTSTNSNLIQNIFKLYDLNDFFKNIPSTIEQIIIKLKDIDKINKLKIDDDFLRFKNLKKIIFEGAVSEITTDLSKLPHLELINISNSPELTNLNCDPLDIKNLKTLVLGNTGIEPFPHIDEKYKITKNSTIYDFEIS